ncbi:helix-turn-helix transcriptional regulator [Streptomyces sp. NPDC013178]|uniref:helix-turn-helix transcriptional regulator n=1 Tax=Streptomyces sp. NPDC013178 TaxID=3155118 RepID=UPI003403E618
MLEAIGRHELEQAEPAAASLAEEYRTAAAEPSVHELVEVVTGAAAVARRLLQIQLEAGEEVCALVTGTPVTVPGGENAVEERAAARGVRCRVVLERAALDQPAGMKELTAALGRGERVRMVEKVPTNLVVADRALALVPLTGRSAEPAALVVHAGGLLELLSGLFESVWREALPLRPGADRVAADPDGPDTADLEILALLLAGLTDASVARQLDLGLRTVQRRVRRLMELTGARTRLQLGWHACERGWVTRED